MTSLGRQFPGPILALALLAASSGAAFGLSMPELVQFLEAEVPEDLILRLLQSSPASEVPTAAEVVALWEAGASSRLLEALLPSAEEPRQSTPQAGRLPDGIRAYYRDEQGGSQVFVLTNLDDDGQRLDGTTLSDTRPNLVTSHPREAQPSPSRPMAARVEVETPRPANPPPAYSPSQGPTIFVQSSPYLGFFYRQPISHLYPPGSNTHFKLYHREGNRPGLGHYQMPTGQVFYNPPFPTAGSHGRTQGRRWP